MADHLPKPQQPKGTPSASSMIRSNPGENHVGERNGRVTTFPDGSKRVDN